MANEFRIKNGYFSEGNSQVTGSLTVTAGITGSLFGTASWAENAVTASFLSGTVATASFAQTASYVLNAVSASFVTSASYASTATNIDVVDAGADTTTWVLLAGNQTGAQTAESDAGLTYNASTNALTAANFIGTASWSSNAVTASYVLNAVSSSFSSTASYITNLNQNVTVTGNVTINGTASIGFLNVTYESASVIYSSGSNQLGDAVSDTQTLIGTTSVSGSLTVTGPATINNLTGSLFGTSSWATNATNINVSDAASDTTTWVMLAGNQTGTQGALSDAGLTYNSSTNALTATAFTGSLFGTSSWASNAVTASYVLNAVSSSFTSTASFVTVLNQNVTITGSLSATGSTSLNNILFGEPTSNALLTAVEVTTTAGNNTIYTLPTASYGGAFYEYIAKSGSNAS
jgi:hypothetical protein